MSVTQRFYAAPFDGVANRYDETFTSSRIGRAQRSAVWAEMARVFRSGDRALEIGCGTGVDACFLAERGVRVVASDTSSQMIAVATRRVQENGLQKLVQPLVLRAEDIGTFSTEELFDGAFSNFGVLNCVEDLRRLARDLAKLLKPGATVLLCWMAPYCLWEMLWYLAQGKRDEAFRRLHPDGVTAKIGDGSFVRVHYPSVGSLAHAFSPEFQLKSVKGIGIAVPPSYLEPWARRHPRWLQLFEGADLCMGRCPGVRALADHVLVQLQHEEMPSGRG